MRLPISYWMTRPGHCFFSLFPSSKPFHSLTWENSAFASQTSLSFQSRPPRSFFEPLDLFIPLIFLGLIYGTEACAESTCWWECSSSWGWSRRFCRGSFSSFQKAIFSICWCWWKHEKLTHLRGTLPKAHRGLEVSSRSTPPEKRLKVKFIRNPSEGLFLWNWNFQGQSASKSKGFIIRIPCPAGEVSLSVS